MNKTTARKMQWSDSENINSKTQTNKRKLIWTLEFIVNLLHG